MTTTVLSFFSSSTLDFNNTKQDNLKFSCKIEVHPGGIEREKECVREKEREREREERKEKRETDTERD